MPGRKDVPSRDGDSDEYRSLIARHRDYDSRLAELLRRPHWSSEEEVEATRLKKLKLQVKDRMALLERRSASGG